jgi:uncharacterized protein YutE (UPF0331/DUF86 family)
VTRDLEAQLSVQRSATSYYQKLLARAYENLRMLGRGDIVKTIESETLKEMGGVREALVKAVPQPVKEDDDCLY